jgi:hypothetical protein
MPATIASLSTRCSGYCVLAYLGVIYRQIMGIGKIHIGAFADGATNGFGKKCWKY